MHWNVIFFSRCIPDFKISTDGRTLLGTASYEYVETVVSLVRQEAGFGFRIVGGTEEGSQVGGTVRTHSHPWSLKIQTRVLFFLNTSLLILFNFTSSMIQYAYIFSNHTILYYIVILGVIFLLYTSSFNSLRPIIQNSSYRNLKVCSYFHSYIYYRFLCNWPCKKFKRLVESRQNFNILRRD